MKIISYALWGNNPKYTIGAIRNVESALDFYPSWLCRFYCSQNVPNDIIEKLKFFPNTQIIQTKEHADWKYSVNRFLPMSEEGVERMISRDTDSRFSIREVDAVNEWINHDTVGHIMKDHPFHGTFPILAGMFGMKGGVVKNIRALLGLMQQVPEQYHYDQIFLQNYIWPFMDNNVTIHDEFFLNKPFPTKRNINQYIGQPFDENELPCFPEHAKLINK